MNIQFTQNAWEEFNYWMDNDIEVAGKIREMIKDIKQNPFKGIGKPEPLRFELQGYWSRRITHEDRLVYRIEGKKGADQTCYIIQCKFHYDG